MDRVIAREITVWRSLVELHNSLDHAGLRLEPQRKNGRELSDTAEKFSKRSIGIENAGANDERRIPSEKVSRNGTD